MGFRETYWNSIKSYDTEEKLDLYLYRPAGFLIALFANKLRLAPTHLSLLGVATGVYGGYLFSKQNDPYLLVIGSLMFILSGIFDSSDGQLARISGKSTRIGMIIDGMCDSVVFGTAYICACIPLIPTYGYWIYPLAVLGGICHSSQCAILDFYNREYIFFGYNRTKNDDYWIPSVEEAKSQIDDPNQRNDRFFLKIRFSWLAQQQALTTRKPAERQKLREMMQTPAAQKIADAYRDNNRTMIRFWRFMGPNFHTILMILFVFLHRFDLYLLFGDILGLNIVMLILRSFQARIDDRFFAQIGLSRS